MELILASTSPYRRKLLERLQIPFTCVAPNVAETPLPDELPQDLALRLALDKARAVADDYPGALVLGSDQVASINGRIAGKPGNALNASRQLADSSGNQVCFYTGLALVHRHAGFEQALNVPFIVHFRTLSKTEIENYLAREQPFDCAGSFKCEGLGVTLFQRLQGDDPTALEGLPLIATCHLLRAAGLDPLA